VDLFTHVLTAYLLTFGLVGFQPSYLAAGAIAGGLPDGDILFFPLWRRFPILRHHGITHSFFGVGVVAAVGAFVGPMIAPGNPLIYFGVLFAGGAAHVLEDGFTNFSVPPLLPFSDHRLQLDADRAINFGTLALSIFSFWLLGDYERGHVPFAAYLWTVYLLMAFFVAYFALRIALRVYLGRHLKDYGPFDVVVATSSPLTWVLLSETKAGGTMRTVYGRLRVLPYRLEGPAVVEAPMEAPGLPDTPIGSPDEALARSYPIARRTSGFLDETYHFADTERRADGWSVVWYSLEYAAFGRAAAVRVTFDAAGRATTRRAWYAPNRRIGAVAGGSP